MRVMMKCRCGKMVDLGFNVKVLPSQVICPVCAALKNAKIRRDVIRRKGINGNLSLRDGVDILRIGLN